MRHRDIPAHLKAVRYLKQFVDKQAPTNSEIACASGCVNGSISYVLTRAIEGGFIAIERSRGMRRFVFADGSKTKWTQRNNGDLKPYVTCPKRQHFTDEQAITAIREYWKSQGFESVDVREVNGQVRVAVDDYGWPVEDVENVSCETEAAHA